jgi:magnesium chelatase family protein
VLNSQLDNSRLQALCTVDRNARLLLQRAMQQLRLSARAYHRILKVARTIADLEGQEQLPVHHLSEAINYRRLDRQASV